MDNIYLPQEPFKVGLDARGAIWYRGTGIGTYTYQLACHLSKLLTQEQLRLFYPGEELRNISIHNKEYFSLFNGNNSRKNYWREEFLPQRLKAEQLDLYHVPQNGIGLPKYKKTKQVVTIHDLIPYIYPETVGKSYLKEFLQEMPQIMEGADGIITVSQQSKKDIISIFNYPADKIQVIYEAAEPMYSFKSKKLCKAVLANRYGIPVDKEYGLYVGGFGPRKNVRGLLVAFAMASKNLEQKPLLLCPGKVQREGGGYLALVRALGLEDQVIFTGFAEVEELPYFYGGATVFVYPSLYEGFGLPILEAMACGCPVITGNNSSLPEVVGAGGIMVNTANTIELAEKIYQVFEDEELAETLTINGLKQAAEFSWQSNAKETLGFYRQLISCKHS